MGVDLTPAKYTDAKAVAAAKADADIADAITKKHAEGSDTALGTLGTKATPVNADKVLQRDSGGYTHYNTGDDSSGNVVYEGQTFTPLITHVITSIILKLFRNGSPGIVTAQIRTVDSSGLPTATILCSGITDCDTLPTGAPYEWREITLGDGYNLSADTKYAIVLLTPTNFLPPANRLFWREDISSPTYLSGSRVNSGDGVSWAVDEDTDFMFEEWGESEALVTSTWTQIKAFFKTYFDSLYSAITHSHAHSAITGVGTDDHHVKYTDNEALTQAKANIEDTPVDGHTEQGISSNWARDHKVQMIDGPLSPGVLSGGIISEGTIGTITISAITALLRTDTGATDPLVYVSLAEQANRTMTSANVTYHVGLDYNGGNPQIVIQAANFNRTTEIGIGKCMKDGSGNVHFQNGGMRHGDGVSKLQRRASSLRATELASGCVISDVGGGTNQFTLDKGVVYHGIHRLTPFASAPYNPFNSNDDKFIYVYGDTANGFTFSDGTDTAIDNEYYYGGSGALALVTVNHYACHWVYIHPDDNHVYVMYGTTNGKLAEAEQAQPTSDLPQILDDFGLLIGCIIIERNATAFTTIQMVTDIVFTGTAVADHNALSNLAVGDVHTQYVKHALATAVSDFLVASGAGVFIKKTLAEVKTILGLGTAAFTAATAYVTHALATATNDFIVASGSGAYVKKTLAEVKTILGITNVENTAHSTDAHTMTIDGVDVSTLPEKITTVASDATPNPTGGSLRNFYTITALAANAIFAVPSGTPANANKLIIRIKDNGTARTLTWNAIYRRLEFALPTTTVISKTLYVGFIYNSADSKWDMVCINEEG